LTNSSSSITKYVKEGPVVVKRRTVHEIKPKPGKDFVYRRVYVDVGKGEISEYNFSEKTSLLTHDPSMDEYAKKPYALIPKGEDVFQLVTPKWTGYKAGWLEMQTDTHNVFRVDRYSAWVGLVPQDLYKMS
jgi:hypothetical protein